MEEILSTLLAYNAGNRGVDREKLENLGLRAIPDIRALLTAATDVLLKIAKSKEHQLTRELAEFFSYRILFLLLPEECLFQTPDRDKPIIAMHLQTLGVEPNEDLIRSIKFLVDNFRNKTRQESSKLGITDIYVKFPKIYDAIFSQQHGRCAVCGTPLEYGINMTLDHFLPWHLGDDPSDGSNWQFLCEVCNRGKGMLPHYSLSALHANWVKPIASHGLTDDVRYAVLRRDGACWKSGKGPREAELTVEKICASGCWVLDNLRTVCR